MTKERKSFKNFLPSLLRILIAAVIFTVAIVFYDELTNIDIRALVQAAPSVMAAVFLIWGVYLVKSLVFVVPASIVYISVGMAFSPLEACLINMAGILIEVFVTYWLGRFLGGDSVENILRKKKGGEKLLNMHLEDKPLFVFGVRFIPAFPIDFSSLFFGAFTKKFWSYLILSVLGLAPRVLLFTVIGDKIYDLIPMKLIVTVGIAAIPISVIVYFIKKLIKKRKAEK